MRQTAALYAGGAFHAVSPSGRVAKAAAPASPKPVLVDADTANEIDDLFAIARAVMEPGFHLQGLTSAQWHTQEGAPKNTVGPSQDLNRALLHRMHREDIPHPQGANAPLPDVRTPRPSDAADFIIEAARRRSIDDKLNVAILGPCTNLASAVLLDPTIVPKVSCHFIGMHYETNTRQWGKNEFNTRNDPHALDVLLNTTNLEFHLMTATASRALVFRKQVVDDHLKGKGGAADFLVQRWETYDRPWQRRSNPTKERWHMWDVALIEAMAQPAMATAKPLPAPPDNRPRSISVWTKIDAEAMEDKYWRVFDRYLNDKAREA